MLKESGWSRQHGSLRVNAKAPDFELPDSTFKTFRPLRSAKKVVLAFFPAAFSGSLDRGCECQLRTMNEDLSGLAAEHGEVAIFGIGRELPFTMAAWSEGMGLSYPLLSDPNLEVSKAFVGVFDMGSMLSRRLKGCRGLEGYLAPNRGLVVIDRGTVVYKWVGADENSGASDPSKLPDLSPVKEALSRERGRL